MQAFPRESGSSANFSKRSSEQQVQKQQKLMIEKLQRLEKRGASQYYLLHFGLPGQKGGRRRFRGRMPV